MIEQETEKKKSKNRSKNKALKRFNGQGTVYKLSGRRREPWVAAITKGYELIEKELADIKVTGSFENGIICNTDIKNLKGKGLKPKTKVKLKITEMNNRIADGIIKTINKLEDGQCLISVKISDEKDNDLYKSLPTHVNILSNYMKRIAEIIDCFEQENQAIDALDLHRLTQNKLIEPVEQKSTMTLGQIYEVYSKTKFKQKIGKSTIDGIKASWKKLSKFEDRIFSEIRSDEFQDIVDECRDIEKASKSSLTKLKSLIYALCDYAYHNGIIKTNYSSLIKIGEVDATEREPFTDLEVNVFKENVDTVPWTDTILVLCYTGMRPIEILSLTKFNIDMEKRIITGGVKTDAGKNRIVPIHSLIYPIFQKWYGKNGETIFCNEKGKKLSVRAYREDRFAPALQAMGVRPLTPYSCRHTFATMMNRVNAPSANIQKIIGHVVGTDTTDKVYTHPEIEDLRKTIEMLK